ncbi:MAG: hypothetical protein GY856_55490 [bacterium]|nr:hypothetical protein [bacterium]
MGSLNALIVVLAGWLGLGFALSGIGLLVRRLFGLRAVTAEVGFLSFWVGWAFAVAILELWHLWFRIDRWALVTVSAIGVIGLIWNRKDLWRWIRSRAIPGGVVVLLLLAGLWVAGRAMEPLQHFDTGYYHLPALKWITAHPIVPGLGNLHGRLAFNSSFLLFAAMVDAAPWAGKAHYPANGLLMFVLLAQALWSTRKLFPRNGAPRIPGLLWGLLLGSILVQILGPELSSLSTDLPVFALSIVISSQILWLTVTADLSGEEWRYRLFCITALAAAGVATKLSLVVFSGSACLIAGVVWWWWTDRKSMSESVKVVLLLVACALVILVPWMVRGVLLSGYVAYPSTWGAFAVDWQVPRPLVINEANWVYSLARGPRIHWSVMLDGWDWFRPWLDRLPPSVTRPSLLAFLALIYALVGVGRRSSRREWPGAPWLFLIPTVLSLIFWFLTAPSPRFAGASFAILGAGTAALAVRESASATSGKRRIRLEHVLWVVFLIYVTFPALWTTHDTLRDLSRIAYDTEITDSGLRVNIPRDAFLCGDIPLPCTPYFRPNLRLIEENNLAGGFILEPDEQRRIPPLPRQNPAMTPRDPREIVPRGFVVSPDLGVTLVSGWRRFENGAEFRVMTATGRLLIYTEQAVEARLLLRPCRIRVADELIESAELMIRLNGAQVAHSEVRPDVAIEVPLPLRRDFNAVALEAAGGASPSGGGVPSPVGLGWVSIGFCSIEITSATARPSVPE